MTSKSVWLGRPNSNEELFTSIGVVAISAPVGVNSAKLIVSAFSRFQRRTISSPGVDNDSPCHLQCRWSRENSESLADQPR